MSYLIDKIFSYLDISFHDQIIYLIKQELLRVIENVNPENVRIRLGYGFLDDTELASSPTVTILNSNHAKFAVAIYVEEEEYNYIFETIENGISFSGYHYDEEALMHYEQFTFQNTNGERKLVKRKDVIDQNDFFYNYQIDIFAFDKNGNPKDTEEEKDQLFSNEFGIPVSLSRFYRTHFKENKDYINQCKIQSEMVYEDTHPANQNLFSSPFLLEDFESVFESDLEDEEQLTRLFDVGYTMDDLEEAKCRIQDLKNILASQIGYEGELVFSYNLYNNIFSYAYNSSSTFLSTSGSIIKYENGEYTMYYIELKNNQITTIAKKLSRDDAQALYYSNPENENINGLTRFFGIERNRRN